MADPTPAATTAPITIEFVGLTEAMRKLGPETVAKVSRAALLKFANEVKLLATPYPPEGSWNRPGPYPAKWYQRHFGARWALVGGGVHGSNTSEQMQKNWIAEQRDDFTAAVGNRASYSPYVMGEEQQGYHAAHGWEKLEDIAKANQDRLVGFVAEELERVMGA